MTGRLRFNPLAKFRKDMLKSALEPFHGVELSSCIRVTRFGPLPSEAPQKSYVAHLWRVDTRGESQRFLPSVVFGDGT